MIPELIQKRGAVHLAAEPADGIRVGDRLVPRAVAELVPESVARENGIFPLALDGDVLTIGSAMASDLSLADKLTFLLNKRVRLTPVPRHFILAAINECYRETYSDFDDSDMMEFTKESLADTTSTAERKPSAAAYGSASRRRQIAVDAHTGRFQAARLDSLGTHLSTRPTPPGLDASHPYWEPNMGMFFVTVEDGQRLLRVRADGRMDVVVGPQRVWRGNSRFDPMEHYVAHPGEFLVVQFRDGTQDHRPGPADVWFDPRVHQTITRKDALQLAAKEAVIVYTRAADAAVTRRIVYGPTLFVPAPGEWLHTFTWHGSTGGSQGAKKVAKGLVFQKLWLMPDQMYHDVPDVRTADDAVLTVRLMIFFELIDVDRMLEASHDPIGDFVNAATSDVVDFTGRRAFAEFKHETGKLNELDAYPQLSARAAQTGYRIANVVYRGYGAPDRLQAMQDQAIEARTKLQLERATEQQAQELEDYKLTAQLARAARRRTEQAVEVDTELDLARKRQEAERAEHEAVREAAREQRRRDATTALEASRQQDDRQRQHLGSLKELGVDLTAYLTQSRADRVIELRGGAGSTHVHLEREGTE
ncbi:MAG: hypothetical protein ACRC7O_09775 [Fimbriiglobus sp.]